MKQIINGADLRRMIISAAAAIEINKLTRCFFSENAVEDVPLAIASFRRYTSSSVTVSQSMVPPVTKTSSVVTSPVSSFCFSTVFTVPRQTWAGERT